MQMVEYGGVQFVTDEKSTLYVGYHFSPKDQAVLLNTHIALIHNGDLDLAPCKYCGARARYRVKNTVCLMMRVECSSGKEHGQTGYHNNLGDARKEWNEANRSNSDQLKIIREREKSYHDHANNLSTDIVGKMLKDFSSLLNLAEIQIDEIANLKKKNEELTAERDSASKSKKDPVTIGELNKIRERFDSAIYHLWNDDNRYAVRESLTDIPNLISTVAEQAQNLQKVTKERDSASTKFSLFMQQPPWKQLIEQEKEIHRLQDVIASMFAKAEERDQELKKPKRSFSIPTEITMVIDGKPFTLIGSDGMDFIKTIGNLMNPDIHSVRPKALIVERMDVGGRFDNDGVDANIVFKTIDPYRPSLQDILVPLAKCKCGVTHPEPEYRFYWEGTEPAELRFYIEHPECGNRTINEKFTLDNLARMIEEWRIENSKKIVSVTSGKPRELVNCKKCGNEAHYLTEKITVDGKNYDWVIRAKCSNPKCAISNNSGFFSHTYEETAAKWNKDNG